VRFIGAGFSGATAAQINNSLRGHRVRLHHCPGLPDVAGFITPPKAARLALAMAADTLPSLEDRIR